LYFFVLDQEIILLIVEISRAKTYPAQYPQFLEEIRDISLSYNPQSDLMADKNLLFVLQNKR